METKHISRRIDIKLYEELEEHCKKNDVSMTSVLTLALKNYLLKDKKQFTVEQATYIVSYMTLKIIELTPEEYKKETKNLYQQALKNLKTYKNLS